MMMKKLTPILFVEAIEPLLPFWEALGFARTIEVPGFVALARDNVEVMLQTLASASADVPAAADRGAVGKSSLYIEVDDIDALESLLPKDAPVVMPRRVAPYGSTEIFVRDPAGNVIGFAQRA
jgi:uncharacterized glyoxalase superfamily protein PhnB